MADRGTSIRDLLVKRLVQRFPMPKCQGNNSGVCLIESSNRSTVRGAAMQLQHPEYCIRCKPIFAISFCRCSIFELTYAHLIMEPSLISRVPRSVTVRLGREVRQAEATLRPLPGLRPIRSPPSLLGRYQPPPRLFHGHFFDHAKHQRDLG